MRIAAIFATTVALTSISASAFACSCMRQTPEDQARMSQSIFVGVPVRTQSMGGRERMTTFRVTDSLKGKGLVQYIYHLENDGGNCGVSSRS